MIRAKDVLSPTALLRSWLIQHPELGGWREEFRFHPERRWRVDFAIPARCPVLLVEIDGGAFIGGRHVRGVGFENDCEKLAEAVSMGYTVLRITPRQIATGKAIDWIVRALSARRRLERLAGQKGEQRHEEHGEGHSRHCPETSGSRGALGAAGVSDGS
ncbi:MAG: endonuclease domain-containing protein [Candidatus Binatia bacterium]|nr:endonuclease domain-containing protein [Candidatus Binatia bacterium]